MLKMKGNNAIFDFFKTIIWTIQINYKVAPFLTVARIAIASITQIDPLLSAVFYAKLIDGFVKLVSSPNISQGLSQNLINSDLIQICGFFILYKIISFGFMNVGYYLERISDLKYSVEYTRLLAEGLKKLSLTDIEDSAFTDKLYRAKECFNELKMQTNFVISVIATFIRIIIVTVSLIYYLPYVLIGLFLLAIPRYIIQSGMLREENRFTRLQTESKRYAQDNLAIIFNNNALPEVKLNGTFEYFFNRYAKFFNSFIEKIDKVTIKRYIVAYIFVVLNYLLIGVAFYQLGNLFINNTFSIGQLTFYISMIMSLSESVAMVLNFVGIVYENNLKFEDLRYILNFKSNFEDGSHDLGKLETAPNIQYKSVNFKYPNSVKNVLSYINFKIEAGEKIAIVGHNGAGKTTLIKSLLRLYEIQDGAIELNGINLKDIKIQSLYKNVGVLFQEYTNYFSLDVFDSVAIGDLTKDASEGNVNKALEDADALDFVNQLPNTLHQNLNEKYKEGIRLSTGQWQKLAIARFLYRDAKVVIFDEPTASIDAVSEAKIFNNIFEKLKDKTVIIISHRFSTVRKADRIIVLDGGRIVEQGSHAELLKLNGVYAKSFNLQAEGYVK